MIRFPSRTAKIGGFISKSTNYSSANYSTNLQNMAVDMLKVFFIDSYNEVLMNYQEYHPEYHFIPRRS